MDHLGACDILMSAAKCKTGNVHIESDKSREKLRCKIQKLKSKTKNRKSTSNFLPGHAQHNKMHAYLNIRGKQLLNINTEFFL